MLATKRTAGQRLALATFTIGLTVASVGVANAEIKLDQAGYDKCMKKPDALGGRLLQRERWGMG